MAIKEYKKLGVAKSVHLYWHMLHPKANLLLLFTIDLQLSHTFPRLRSLAHINHWHEQTATTVQSSSSCKECPVGYYSSSEFDGRARCIACPAGTYQNKSASSSCIPCEAGFYSETPAASSECSRCRPGTYADDKQTSVCKPCPWGFFVASEGSKACLPCARYAFHRMPVPHFLACNENCFALNCHATLFGMS